MRARDGPITQKPDRPRTMRDPAVRAERKAMLGLPHVVPLSRYAASLRGQGRGSVPGFDPLDGGTAVQALFLLEKPGPMTDASRAAGRAGSGFVSRDNDDATAEAIFRFMAEAGLARDRTVLWNVVPWWNGTQSLTAPELRDGVGALRRLIELLPDLRIVVLVGGAAARARPLLESGGLPVFASAHPSPRVRAFRPDLWNAIPREWKAVAPFLD